MGEETRDEPLRTSAWEASTPWHSSSILNFQILSVQDLKFSWRHIYVKCTCAIDVKVSLCAALAITVAQLGRLDLRVRGNTNSRQYFLYKYVLKRRGNRLLKKKLKKGGNM